MNWVLIIVAIAVTGLVITVAYGVWLAHKASDLFAEVKMLGTRAEEFSELLEQLEPVPEPGRSE